MVHKNSWAKIEKNCTWPMFVRYSVSSFSLLLCWRISIHLSCLQKWVSASSAVCVLEITEVLYHHPSPRISLPPLPPKKPPPPLDSEQKWIDDTPVCTAAPSSTGCAENELLLSHLAVCHLRAHPLSLIIGLWVYLLKPFISSTSPVSLSNLSNFPQEKSNK